MLVTSRQSDQATWGRLAVLHGLDPLSPAESAQVLRDLAPDAGDQAEAEALGRRLGGLPLALHLAGSHLGSGLTRWTSFEAYRRALAPELLRPDPDLARDQRTIVTRTWEISLDDLAHRGLPQARSMLRLLSCYAAAVPIPLDLLQPTLLATLLSPPAARGQDAPSVDAVLRGLARVGLVEATAGAGALMVHPVVADTSRLHLLPGSGHAAADAALIRRTAVAVLVDAIDDLQPDRPFDWARYRLLTPHLHALLSTVADGLDQEELATLITAAIAERRPWLAWGHASSTREFLATVLVHARRLGDDHPTTLEARVAFACVVGHLGRWDEAMGLFEQVLGARMRTVGPEHPDTLTAMHDLATAAYNRRQWREAEVAFRRVLDARQRVLGVDHPDTLNTRHRLAWAVGNQGRWAEAEAIFGQVLESRRSVLGDDHPDTLSTRHRLAMVVAEQGRWVEAEADFRDLLARRRLVLGADNPHTATIHSRLAWALAGQGRWEEAADSYQQVVAKQQELRGDDHPDTLRARYELALVLIRLRRREEADTQLRDVLIRRQRAHGPDHADTLATKRALAELAAEGDGPAAGG